MATSVQRASQLTMADLKGKVDPDWCPGCGDFGVLAALQKALVELQIPTHSVVTISGIGCSSNLPGYINTYGMQNQAFTRSWLVARRRTSGCQANLH